MSFFDKLLKNRERTRLEESLRKEPSAAAFLRLARVLQEEGDRAAAWQTAKRGAAAFPGDSELVRLEAGLAAQEREAECLRLREQIENYPNGRLYARLAELYRVSNEIDKAFEVARSGLAGFPDNDGLHYTLGRLHADRGAAEEACQHLRRAAELDRYNYSALKLLGQLLEGLARHAEAAEAFARILGFAPDDEEVKASLERTARAGGVNPAPRPVVRERAPAAVVTASSAPAAAESAPESLSASSAPAPAPAPGDNSLTAIALSRLQGKDGIGGAVLADAAGLPVAAALPAGQDDKAVAAAVAGLRRGLSPVCGEFGLGSFEDAIVEMEDGGFHVYAMKELSLGVFTQAHSRPGLVAIHARAFARKLAQSGGEEHRP